MSLKKLLLPVVLALLFVSFYLSKDFQQIAAGVAIFLFGMLMLEDGFRLLSGGFLERLLTRATRTIPRSIGFGFLTTSLMQSSSLVSIITISFLSAGLITLLAGVGIVFGANIGTTTGAWLVAGFGLKVNISAYALPMLAVGIILVFQSNKYLRGTGYVLGGLGFLFLGIHFMKEGFEAFNGQFDLSRFAMVGALGLLVYTLIGAVATVVMQSSHATMVLVITALAAGQISYENALALAIGANIGTTITALIGAFSSNFQGKRLALAHLIFNLLTAGVALILINPIVSTVDWISAGVGISDTDYSLKLAVFHTLFNLLGVILMLPAIHRLITFLEKTIPEPATDISRPRHLSNAVYEFPETVEVALSKEVAHLGENAIDLIARGLNLRLEDLYASRDLAATVRSSRAPVEFEIDTLYDHRIKVLHAAILEFATRAGGKKLPEPIMQRIYDLRDAAGRLVSACKAVKHLRRNATAFTRRPQGKVTELYDGLRTEIARIIVELHKLDETAPEDRSGLWLDQERLQIDKDRKTTIHTIENLIRNDEIDARKATSFVNDSGYAYQAMLDLLAAAQVYAVQTEGPMAEVERILALDEEDVAQMSNRPSPPAN
jgi:phosphate:Na+ symporter